MDVIFDDTPQLTNEALMRVLNPIGTARGLPNACYIDPAIFALEQRRVFAEGWACVGFVKDVLKTGDLSAFEFAGMPLLMVRGTDDIVRIAPFVLAASPWCSLSAAARRVNVRINLHSVR